MINFSWPSLTYLRRWSLCHICTDSDNRTREQCAILETPDQESWALTPSIVISLAVASLGKSASLGWGSPSSKHGAIMSFRSRVKGLWKSQWALPPPTKPLTCTEWSLSSHCTGTHSILIPAHVISIWLLQTEGKGMQHGKVVTCLRLQGQEVQEQGFPRGQSGSGVHPLNQHQLLWLSYNVTSSGHTQTWAGSSGESPLRISKGRSALHAALFSSSSWLAS